MSYNFDVYSTLGTAHSSLLVLSSSLLLSTSDLARNLRRNRRGKASKRWNNADAVLEPALLPVAYSVLLDSAASPVLDSGLTLPL